MKRNPNPQGKGLTPVLEEWHGAQPALVTAKPPRQVMADYFTTLLVLSADFSFKPAPGVEYFLYLGDGGWLLSLISPAEWRARAPGPCVGRCELQLDMTWILEPEKNLGEKPDLVEALSAFQDGFIDLLDGEAPLEESLPYYVASLPYYRRLLAAGMAKSLDTSLTLAGLSGHSGRHWLETSPLPRLG